MGVRAYACHFHQSKHISEEVSGTYIVYKSRAIESVGRTDFILQAIHGVPVYSELQITITGIIHEWDLRINPVKKVKSKIIDIVLLATASLFDIMFASIVLVLLEECQIYSRFLRTCKFKCLAGRSARDCN